MFSKNYFNYLNLMFIYIYIFIYLFIYLNVFYISLFRTVSKSALNSGPNGTSKWVEMVQDVPII